MYNLLVTVNAGAWDSPSYVLGRGRFLEHTSDELKERLGTLSDQAVAELTGLPTLFAYESPVSAPSQVGWIKTIQTRQADIRITFQRDPSIQPIDPAKIDEMAWDLDLGGGELDRTHWAVKEVDLLEVLRKAGLFGAGEKREERIYKFSRRTLLNACDVLRRIGHSEFDRFLLEIGIDGIGAGRDRGGLMARSTALSAYVVKHAEELTAEGEPLALTIVRRAAQADPSTTDADFWNGLKVDGYVLSAGNIVADQPTGLTQPPYRKSPTTPFQATSKLSPTGPPESETVNATKHAKVFIVHGRDDGAKHEVARFLEHLDLKPVILHERPNGGRTLISKFQEESAEIEFAVVIMTPDDVGGLADGSQKPRARQNVIFELGFFIGRLEARKVCALVKGDIEKPSDFDAIVYVKYGPGDGWKAELARELRSAGVVFDPSRILGV